MNQTDHPSHQKKTLSMLPIYSDSACCSAAPAEVPSPLPRPDQGFITGSVSTPTGSVPRVSSELQWLDRWGTFKARWGVGRMDYAVDPGLYALGHPDGNSPVLVTANYKMSFDSLRSALPGGMPGYWSSIRRGSMSGAPPERAPSGRRNWFGRIELSGLKEGRHPPVTDPSPVGSAGRRRPHGEETFRVSASVMVRSSLRPSGLSGCGLQGHPWKMRLKTFSLKERAVLIPVELVEALKPALIITPVVVPARRHGRSCGFWANGPSVMASFAVMAFLSAVLGGAVLHPLLLPYLPGRAFSTKGLCSVSWWPLSSLSFRRFGRCRLGGAARKPWRGC